MKKGVVSREQVFAAKGLDARDVRCVTLTRACVVHSTCMRGWVGTCVALVGACAFD